MRIPDNELEQLCAGIEAAEKAGFFNGMFKGECRTVQQSVNKNTFLYSLRTGMKLYKSTFKKIYGYELSYPGFAEKALSGLEILGCSRAREYYEAIRSEIEMEKNQQMKKAAEWYSSQEINRKAVSEPRTEKEVEQLKADLQRKSDRELLILLQSLKQRKEENGGPFQIRGRLG